MTTTDAVATPLTDTDHTATPQPEPSLLTMQATAASSEPAPNSLGSHWLLEILKRQDEMVQVIENQQRAIRRLEQENIKITIALRDQEHLLSQHIERGMAYEQSLGMRQELLSHRLSEQEMLAYRISSTTASPQTPTNPVVAMPSAQPAQPAVSSDILLEFEGVETLFYRNTSFPEFRVQVGGVSGPGYTVKIDLWNHFNQSLLTGSSERFAVRGGVAHVTGLRFMEVSSKHGRYYHLSAALFNPAGQRISTCRSPRIEIKSERLRHEKPKSATRLSPSDEIERMPKIGKQYASRLRDQNILTIRDLAELTDERMEDILNVVRKHRGLMTRETFCDMREKARQTLERSKRPEISSPDQASESDEDRPSKRTKVDTLASVASTPLPSPDVADGVPVNPNCSSEKIVLAVPTPSTTTADEAQ